MWKIIKKILIPKSEKYLKLYKKYGNISFWNKITNTKKKRKIEKKISYLIFTIGEKT
jgi:hypothetical protein